MYPTVADAVEVAGGVRDDRAEDGSARPWASARGRLRAGRDHRLQVGADALAGDDAGAPVHVAATAADAWEIAERLLFTPTLAWHQRGAWGAPGWQGRAVLRVGPSWDTVVFLAIERRWEGIDTDTLPLVRRDEVLLGAGTTVWPDVRIKLTALGALRDPGVAHANLQLALHRVYESGWGVEAACTWWPALPDVNTGLEPVEAGALVSWQGPWRVAPRVGIGAGVRGGRRPLRRATGRAAGGRPAGA